MTEVKKKEGTIRWTADQRRVIDERGGNILVSASAGSGKTAVLVERVLSYVLDPQQPANIDELLVVTFTRAAAAEMKERIGNRIAGLLEADPENEHLALQTTLIHNAQITTIDGFCAYVVRTYGHLTDLEPGWRIAEEGESRLLKADVLAEVLEEAFASEDEGMKARFPVFVESLATGKNEKPLEDAILRVFEAAQSQPWPRDWLEMSRRDAAVETLEELEALPWMQDFKADADSLIKDGLAMARRNLTLTRSPAGPSAYLPCAEADVALFEKLMAEGAFDGRVRLLWDFEAPRLSSKRPLAAEDPALRDVFKKAREDIKAIRELLAQEFYFCHAGEALEMLKKTSAPMEVLISVTEAFMDRFAEKKRERKLIDFADLEHYALRILRGDKGRTPAARELAGRFREVLVDEYQDSNYLQEEILTAVSGVEDGRDNYFCVGDVKQSIYGFRHARPDLFMEKFRLYRERPGESGMGPKDANRKEESASGGHSVAVRGKRIDLRSNFRSGAEVLDSANGFFEMLMRKEVGGVTYDEEAALVCALNVLDDLRTTSDKLKAALEKAGDRTSFLKIKARVDALEEEILREERLAALAETEILAAVVDEEDEEGGTVLADTGSRARWELEARMIGERILRMVREEVIYDRKTGEFRPVEYRDVVILLRTMKGWAEVFNQVLESMGIPAYSTARTGYFSAPEVRIILDYLAILDNPEQDIPFASVLKSAIGGVTARELALIRVVSDSSAAGGEARFLSMAECARRYAAAGEDGILRDKLNRFFAFYNETRDLTACIPIHELIWHILTGTGFFDYASALPGGVQRAANLRMLVEKAIAYESGSYVGLFNFIRYMEKLQTYEVDFGEVNVVGENENTVRIISIHKSKGLEYPVVFAAGMGKAFNKRELSDRVLIDPEGGVAMDYVDLDLRTVAPTLKKQAIRRKLMRETVGEELRVLYVALTRARQKMILTGSLKTRELENYRRIEPGDGGRFSPNYLLGASCPWAMLLPAAGQLMKKAGKGRYPRAITLIYPTELLGAAVREGASRQEIVADLRAMDPAFVWDQDMREIVEERFSYVYPYAGRESLPVKVSVTELKKARMRDEELVELTAALEEGAARREPDSLEAAAALEEVSAATGMGAPGESVSSEGAAASEEMSAATGGAPGETVASEETAAADKETYYVPVFARTGDDTRAYESDDTPATVRGSACHKVMELLDFSRFYDENALAAAGAEIARMVAENRMAAEDAALVNPSEIAAMATSPLGRRMAAAAARGDLYREQPFVLAVAASELRPMWPEDEQVIVQGIVDAFFIEGNKIILIDYKTDRIPRGEVGESRLRKRYQAQLDAYQTALERVGGRPVTEKYLWSFHLGRPVEVRA